MNAFDVIGGPVVTPSSFAKAAAYLQQAYGVEFPKEKFAILFELILDEGWTEERFNRTLKWFLKTKYNQAWTIADWFQWNVKLYPFAWVRQHCHKNGLREVDFIRTLDVYIVDGIRLYKMKDGIDLPLKRDGELWSRKKHRSMNRKGFITSHASADHKWR